MLKGTVRTAFALTPAEKSALEQRFAGVLGQAVEREEQEDPSLLAGVCVVVDGRMYDGSLKSRLAAVEHVLEDESEEAGGNA